MSQTDGKTTHISDSSTITTSNGEEYGLLADESGSVVSADHNITITTKGDKAYGAQAINGGAIQIGDSATIITKGYQGRGTYATDKAYLQVGDHATIKTSGNLAGAAQANLNSSLDIGDYAIITTSGDTGYGGYAVNKGNIQIGHSANVTILGDLVSGFGALDKSSIEIGNSVDITTYGKAAIGANAYGESKMAFGDNASITTYGNESLGVRSEGYSSIDIGANANITTAGKWSYGVGALGHANVNVGEGATISTTGTNSYALFAHNGAHIKLGSAVISATGADTYSIYSELNSSVIGSGVYNITGDMFAQNAEGSGKVVIDMTLENGSMFSGNTSYTTDIAAGIVNLTLNGADTKWRPTGDSELTNLHMDGATVEFTQDFGLSLTAVNLGQSDSDSGIFRMRAAITDEEADKLVATGGAKGKYVIDIINCGGDAATGDEVIDLVLIMNAGQSAAFELDHTVEHGGWSFALHPPDRDSEPMFPLSESHDESAWYLYPTRRASTTGSGAINSFAGSYLMADAEMNTLIQRLGDLRDSKDLSGVWFRAHGGKFESNSKSYVRGFDMKYGGVQVGYDRKIEDVEGGDLYTGVMFGYAKGDLDYSHEGSGRVDSKALGIYGIYVKPDGFYIDTVLKYQWMTNDFNVIDTAGTLVRGKDVNTGGIGASVEVGKRFHIDNGKESATRWYVEPQIQLSYQHQNGGHFMASNGLQIGVESFSSLLGRIGMLVGYETDKTNFYAKLSQVKEFDGDLAIRANGVPIEESFGDNWWVYGLGLTTKINDRNSLHLDVERTSGGTFSQPWRVSAGWRVTF